MSHHVPRPPGRVPAVSNPSWRAVGVVLAAWAVGPVLVVSAVSFPSIVAATLVGATVATRGRRWLSRRGPTPSVGRTDDRLRTPGGGRRRRGGPDGGRT